MKRKESLYAVIGGVVGAVLTMAAGSFFPLEAHDEALDLDLGRITCKSLSVVNSEFRVDIIRGGIILEKEDGAKVTIGVSGETGDVRMWSGNGNGKVEITAREDGAGVFVVREDNQTRASITAKEDGGEVSVSDSSNMMNLQRKSLTLAGLKDGYLHFTI